MLNTPNPGDFVVIHKGLTLRTIVAALSHFYVTLAALELRLQSV